MPKYRNIHGSIPITTHDCTNGDSARSVLISKSLHGNSGGAVLFPDGVSLLLGELGSPGTSAACGSPPQNGVFDVVSLSPIQEMGGIDTIRGIAGVANNDRRILSVCNPAGHAVCVHCLPKSADIYDPVQTLRQPSGPRPALISPAPVNLRPEFCELLFIVNFAYVHNGTSMSKYSIDRGVK